MANDIGEINSDDKHFLLYDGYSYLSDREHNLYYFSYFENIDEIEKKKRGNMSNRLSGVSFRSNSCLIYWCAGHSFR